MRRKYDTFYSGQLPCPTIFFKKFTRCQRIDIKKKYLTKYISSDIRFSLRMVCHKHTTPRCYNSLIESNLYLLVTAWGDNIHELLYIYSLCQQKHLNRKMYISRRRKSLQLVTTCVWYIMYFVSDKKKSCDLRQ